LPLHVFQNYWDNNGKVFEFTALPKEIQDTIVATCLFQKPTYYTPQVSKSVKEKSFWEIYVALGDCKSLCRTSISIRSTIVKILFAKQEFRYSTTKELSAALTRLNKFKQVVHPTALPQSMSRIARKVRYMDEKRYQNYPRFYPGLSYYGTMMHRIQNLCLAFDPVGFLAFFEFSHGGFDWGKLKKRDTMSWKVLKKLPDLKVVNLEIPQLQQFQEVPMLFHASKPCVYTMYGWIIEAAFNRLRLDDLTPIVWFYGGFVGKLVEEHLVRLNNPQRAIGSPGPIGESDGGAPIDAVEEDTLEEVYPPACLCTPLCTTMIPIAI
jgi:hypothetical protein